MKGFNYPKNNFYKGLKKLLTINLSLIILASAFSGCSLLPVEEEVQTSAVISLKDVDYTLYEVRKRNFVYNIQGQGVFISSNPCNCSVNFGGNSVERVMAKEGDIVKKGDVLLEFDKGDLEYQIKEQKLKLEYKKCNYEKAVSLKSSAPELEKARLLLSVEEDNLNALEGELEKKQLRAPVGGMIIFSEELKPGDKVYAGLPLFKIADPNKLDLLFKEKSGKKLPEITKNTEVMLMYNNNLYKGTVLGNTDSSDSYAIKMNALPQGAAMGTSIDVTLNIVNKKNVMVIPKKAIKVKDEKLYVIVIENGSRVKKDVDVGAETDNEIEITKGLKEGDKVIIN